MTNISKALRERKTARLNVYQLRGYRRINEIIRLFDARLRAWGQLPNHGILCSAWFLICDALYTRFGGDLDLPTVEKCVWLRAETMALKNEDIALEQLHRVCDIADRKKGAFKMTTDTVAGRRIELESLEREAMGIRTMYAYDRPRREVKLDVQYRRRINERHAKALKRLKEGATPRAEAHTRTKPWEALGMSRPTWYRKGKPAPWELLDMTLSEWIKKGKPQPAVGNVVTLAGRR